MTGWVMGARERISPGDTRNRGFVSTDVYTPLMDEGGSR